MLPVSSRAVGAELATYDTPRSRRLPVPSASQWCTRNSSAPCMTAEGLAASTFWLSMLPDTGPQALGMLPLAHISC